MLSSTVRPENASDGAPSLVAQSRHGRSAAIAARIALYKEAGQVNADALQLKRRPTSVVRMREWVELIGASSSDWQTGKHLENTGKMAYSLDRAAASLLARPTGGQGNGPIFRPSPAIVTSFTRVGKSTHKTHDATKTPISRAQKAHTRQTSKAPAYYIPKAEVWRGGVINNNTRFLLTVYGGKSWV